MDETEAAETPEDKSRIRHYANTLNPLFWHDEFNRVDRLFELVCTLVRASGIKDTGWDSHLESINLLDDLGHLCQIELPTDKFPFPDNTRVRLTLISYCHATEMNFPYELVANLLRLHLGMNYCMHPFAHLDRPITKKVNGVKIVDKSIAASPDKKIKEIETLSEKAGFSEVGVAFRQIYDPVIRNAVYHSDYVVQADSMRLLSGNWLSKKGGHYTPLIPFDELGELTSEAFAFHSALLALYRRACRSFTDFKGAFLPYDLHYKSLLELTFDDDLITGFRTYWPNATIGAYVRSADSMCLAQNIRFRPEGSIDFMVGIIASKPGLFSPCVEFDAQPIYAKVPGTELQPYWPMTLSSYKLLDHT
jgi:hypothetical protein